MGKGRKAGARPKQEKSNRSSDAQPNFSDASVQLFHPAHEGDQASTTVIITVGDEQLAFNCVEGFQRMCSECNTKASRLNAVLMTSITFRTCNGLPGAVVSCAEAAKTSRATLSIAGPRGIGRFMNAMAAYSDYVLHELNLNVKELPSSDDGSMYTVLKKPVYSSAKVSCYAVLLNASKGSGTDSEDGPPAKRARTAGGENVPNTEQNGDNSTKDSEGDAVESKAVAVYVCVLSSKRGKFNAEKAIELGLSPGPNFGKLSKGQAVTTPAGNVIQPEMCMESAVMGECITLIECPSAAYIPALVAAMPAVNTLMQDPDGKRVKTVFHIGPEDVVMYEEYQQSLLHLQQCKHFAAEKKFDPSAHAPPIRKATLLQLQLHLMCPGMIPAPTMLPMDQLAAARVAILEPLPPLDPNARKKQQPEPKQDPILSKKEVRQKEAKENAAKQRAARRKGKGGSKSVATAAEIGAAAEKATTAQEAPTAVEADENTATDAKEDTMPNQSEQASPEKEEQVEEAPAEVVKAVAVCNEEELASEPVAEKQVAEPVAEPAAKKQGKEVDAAGVEGNLKEAAKVDVVKGLPADGEWMRLQHLEKLILRPISRRGLCGIEVGKPLDAHAVVAQLRTEFRSAVEAAQGHGEIDRDSEMDDCQAAEEGFQTVFLGTGAACPSKYRNVTSIYLDFYERGGLLLDCGEASLGQLIRRFGVEDAKRRIKELRAIWISHRHADHHVGVSRVLALRRQLLPADVAPLPVFGPPPLRRVLSACNKLEAMHYTWIDQYCICPQEQGKGRDLQYCWEHASKFDAGPIVKAVCESLGLMSISSVLNIHCKHSFGFRMVSHSGNTFVFSGDTEKCDNVINAAKEADILVHEATFESDMIADAKFKKHSTIEDALAVAAEAQCKAVVLTHFSQRYPKVGKLSNVCEGRAAVAFDMMTVDSRRLHLNSALLIKVLNKFFSDDVEEEVKEPEEPAAVEMEEAPQAVERQQNAGNLQLVHA